MHERFVLNDNVFAATRRVAQYRSFQKFASFTTRPSTNTECDDDDDDDGDNGSLHTHQVCCLPSGQEAM